jgi:hypothetical protein
MTNNEKKSCLLSLIYLAFTIAGEIVLWKIINNLLLRIIVMVIYIFVVIFINKLLEHIIKKLGVKRFEKKSINKLKYINKIKSEKKIEFITNECINWFLDNSPLKTPNSFMENSWIEIEPVLFTNSLINNIIIEKESVLALYFWERATEFHKLYVNNIGDKTINVSCMNMDLNYVVHFAKSKELIGLVSCLRKDLNLSKENKEIEYNISRIMLGKIFEDNEFKMASGWQEYVADINNNIIPNYYYSWKDNNNLLYTVGIPIFDEIKSDLMFDIINSDNPYIRCLKKLSSREQYLIFSFNETDNANNSLFYITKPEYKYL